MSFLFPAFLAGALAVAIPIVLHFVRGRSARPMDFSDLRFLRRAQAAAVRRRRLQEWLLLALRVAALLLLALAFARPYGDAPPPADAAAETEAAADPDLAQQPGADDGRDALAAAAAAGAVVLVGGAEETFYLERALGVAADGVPADLRLLAPEAVDGAALAGADVVWLLASAGLDRAARAGVAAFVSRGGGLLAAAGPRFDPALAADLLGVGTTLGLPVAVPAGAAGWSPSATRHPVFQVFTAEPGGLAAVRFSERRPVTLPQGQVLAVFADGSPALVEAASGAGRLLLFASDLGNAWNDFPRRPAFVPFVHEVTRHLAARRPAPPRPPTAVAAAPGSEALDAPDAAEAWWWYAILAVAVLLVAESWLGR